MVRTKESDLGKKAVLRGVRMSPHKVRRVLDQIRGRTYEEVLILLEFLPYKARIPILKVVYAAGANAKNNFGLERAALYISKAWVDQGPKMRRFRPRAQGRAFPIAKPTCNITVFVKSK
uniref:ribosomal protein L22 n=1 Tax=Klebsormidium dissectum TaxID=329816 RepID=UPI00286B5ECE|nr:ribosomal protein L22 [Klebsormidium dissectum]WKT06525.1 ribosomal protein L22 [Klebsormidium dissectum]